MFYAIGGSFNISNDFKMTPGSECKLEYRGSIVAFCLSTTGNELAFKSMINNDETLKINFPAITYVRSRDCVYIVGGLKPDFSATDSILEFNVTRNTLKEVAKMVKKRYNHTCTNYNERIYIAGGVTQ
jgi:hypothetical protein